MQTRRMKKLFSGAEGAEGAEGFLSCFVLLLGPPVTLERCLTALYKTILSFKFKCMFSTSFQCHDFLSMNRCIGTGFFCLIISGFGSYTGIILFPKKLPFMQTDEIVLQV